MKPSVVTERQFVPGTTGWSVDDLDDPEIDRLWVAGAYELVEGVLVNMPAAYYDSGVALQNLIWIIRRHLERSGTPGSFATEADLILNRRRIARVDAVFLTPEDEAKQRKVNTRSSRPDLKFGRLRLPPTLVIESVSLGHEEHDEQTKRLWYAEAEIRNYWILNAFTKSLQCLVLEGAAYRVDQSGSGDDILQPILFPGLMIPLSEVWP